MSRRDAAAVLALCSWVRKHLSKIEDAAKIEAEVTFPEEKVAGAFTGKVVSYTSRVSRKPELELINETAFIAWVAEHYPTEIQPQVRPAFLTELRDRALDTGVVLGPGGEVCEHAQLAEPVVYTTTRLAKGADDILAPVLSQVALADLPAFVEGRTDDGAQDTSA